MKLLGEQTFNTYFLLAKTYLNMYKKFYGYIKIVRFYMVSKVLKKYKSGILEAFSRIIIKNLTF